MVSWVKARPFISMCPVHTQPAAWGRVFFAASWKQLSAVGEPLCFGAALESLTLIRIPY